MQRIRQLVLDLSRAALPVRGVHEPIGAVGNKRPRPDVGNPICQCIDVTIRAICEGNLLSKPIFRNALF